jgi:hypothetical protein
MTRPRTTIGGGMVLIALIGGGLGAYRAGRRAEQLAHPRPVMVWTTAHGSRWHREGCRYLRGGGLAVELDQLRADPRRGPCTICRPPR